MSEDKGIDSTSVDNLADTPSEGKKKSKISFGWMKKRWVRLVAILAVVVTVIVGGVALFLWWRNENASIKIGDTEITLKQIKANTSDMSDFLEKNEDLGFENDDIDQQARDDLILNAGLKKYNSDNCNVEITLKDYYNVWSSDEASEGDMRSYLDSIYAEDGEFQKVRTENEAYKAKMQDCVIVKKDIFRMFITYNSPYFQNLSDADRKVAYDDAKARLINDVLPLIKEGKSYEEIAGVADINWIDNTHKEGFDPGPNGALVPFFDVPVLIASLDKYGYSSEDPNYMTYNDIDMGDILGLEKPISMNDTARNLKNPQDSTEVVTGMNGEFAILRLERLNEGNFNSWDEFLDGIKRETDISAISFDAAGNNIYAAKMGDISQSRNKTGLRDGRVCRYSGNTPDGQTNTEDCFNKSDFTIDVYNNSTCAGYVSPYHSVIIGYAIKQGTSYVSGARVNSEQQYGCRYNTKDVSTSSVPSGSPIGANAFSAWNCFGAYSYGDPNISARVTLTVPSGYTLDGTYNLNTISSLNGGIGGKNGSMPGVRTINLRRTANWSANPQSYVSTTRSAYINDYRGSKSVTIYPGQTAYFYHTAGVASGGVGIEYDIQLKGSNNTRTDWNGYSGYYVNGSHKEWVHRVRDVTTNFDYRAEGPASGSGIQRSTAYASFTPTASDIGTTYCQWIYMTKTGHDQGGESLNNEKACVKIVARPWRININASINKNGGSWTDGDIDIYPGETVNWRHTATNNSGHSAPGASRANRGWQSLGYHMRYGDTSKPTAANGGSAYVRYQNWDPSGVFNNGTTKTFTADSDSHHGTTPGGLNNTYSRNNNSRPPTNYTATLDDIGKYFCQRTYIGAYQDRADETQTAWRCARVVARPWELTTRSRVRTDSSGSAYVDRSGDLNAKVGENAYWQHSLINNTGHTAPSDTGSHGFASFGYSLHYNLANNSSFNPNNQYVRRIGGTNMRSVGNNTTLDYYASETGAEGVYGLGNVYGQDTNGTNLNYGRNNDGQVPVHKLIRPGDVGKRFCQRGYVGRNKDITLGGALTYGNISCVYVPYDYELTPKITVPSESTGGGIDLPKERGTRVDPVPVVENPGGTATRDTRWKVSQWTVPATRESAVKDYNATTDNTNSDPCAVFNGVYGITQVQSGCSVTHEGTRLFNSTTTLTGQINSLTVPDDAELGSRFCFALSINPYSFNDGQTKDEQDAAAARWRHSPPVCILVVKYPKMQVWSNGIYSAGGIRTHRSTINGETFGSWVEYEALATGQISGFASAATNRFSSENPDRLTLSNNRTQKGNWGAWNSTSVSSVVSNLETRYPYGATPGSGTTFREVPNRNAAVMRTTASRYTLSSNPYASTPGKTVIIMAGNTDIDITGNIVSRAPTSGNVSEFQQIIIIGRNIRIAPGVERVDAWLISSGDIVTCARSASGVLNTDPSFVTQANCGRPLKINGPIISHSLKSWRTGGSDVGDLDAPSEIYNQRPDTYIWAYGQSGGDGKIITTYSKELPARF